MEILRATCSVLAISLLAPVPGGAVQRETAPTRPKLDFTPFGDTWKDTWKRPAELIPVLAGDEVLVTSSLRLFAFDARTAELRWSAGPPAGWDGLEVAVRKGLFSGVGDRLWIAPAAGERVAVAALQVPLSRHPVEEWQGIPISTPTPERRLFAFELGTGCPLWNHAPPPGWDGSSGSFAQRMSLSGSPTIVGGCVLVPCVSDASSIDYHVACYELTTGALLWSAFVVRGQVERNMFGKALSEFAGAPLVAVPARGLVLAQTGLGIVAALDLASGSLLWGASYESLPLPKVRSYVPPKRKAVWRTTPPLAIGDVVLATPPDSEELLALDLSDGRVLWSAPMTALCALDPDTEVFAFDHLIGGGESVLYLGGAKVSALAKPGGLRSTKALEPLWTELVQRPYTSGRARLAGDAIFLAGPIELLVLDRESGRTRGSHALDATRGLLITDEDLYALADDGLTRIQH